MEHRHTDRISQVLHWSARLAAVFFFGVVALFMTGESPPPLTRVSVATGVELASLAVILVGYALGWRHATLGGALALAGIATIHTVELVVNGRLAGWMFTLMAIPAILYIATGAVAARESSPDH